MIVSFINTDDKRKNMKSSLYFSENRSVMPTHKELAEVLEFRFHPYERFIRYINADKTYRSFLADAVLYSDDIGSFQNEMTDNLRNLWRYWLKENLGSFKTSNPTPLIDTKQYMNNLTFRVKLQATEANLVNRYHKEQNDYTRETIYDRIVDFRYKFDGIK